MPNESASLLVVDDDPLVLKSLCEYLRVEGYRVSAAQSLRKAWRCWRRTISTWP